MTSVSKTRGIIARSERRTWHFKTRCPSPRRKADGVHRRSDSRSSVSDYMRHRERRSWREWEKIGAIVQTLKWILESVSIPFKNKCPPPRFNQRVPLLDATSIKLEFGDLELACFVQAGAWEPSTCDDYVSRLLLVLKPGNNQWMLCDVRPLTKYCV
jgi:hypothetical protein